jgi:hypothetical protein
MRCVLHKNTVATTRNELVARRQRSIPCEIASSPFLSFITQESVPSSREKWFSASEISMTQVKFFGSVLELLIALFRPGYQTHSDSRISQLRFRA